MRLLTLSILTFSLVLILGGCQTYYTKTLTFNQKFEDGNYSEARSYLASQEKLKSKNSKVLYDLNYATTSFWLDDTQESIKHFDTADKYADDFSKNYAYGALSLISNPTVRPYELEYFESVMLHFYQAINYLKLNNMEDALVECRRMNLILDQQSDAFRKHNGKRYSRDAFGHLLMAYIYEMSADYNNAFIAYRNALEIYTDDYSSLYDTPVPESLKRGIIRTAYRTGFTSQARSYEKRFNLVYDRSSSQRARALIFLLDGMSPVKTEFSYDFVKTSNSTFATFTNEEYGLQIPVFFGDCSPSEKSSLKDFSYVRLTLPKYVNRGSRCNATLSLNGNTCSPDLVENVQSIAHQSLKDRMWREFGKAILRAATKETLHQAAAKQNDYIGLFVNIANAVTEKADTRSWTSLPAYIRVADLDLDPGSYNLSYTSCNTESAKINLSQGQTTILCLRGF